MTPGRYSRAELERAEERGRKEGREALMKELTGAADEADDLTIADVRAMTQEEINANWDRVQQVLHAPTSWPDEQQQRARFREEFQRGDYPLTLDAVRSGALSNEEIMERQDEIAALLQKEGGDAQ